jgi:hypothetical protein
MNEIEISNKAFHIAHQLQVVGAQIVSLAAEAGRVQMACLEYSNGDICPAGYNIDPIPNTPFFVVYRPNLDGEIYGIYCRGAEVTDYLDAHTVELAEQIAIEAVADEQAKTEDWQADQKIDARCSVK